MIRALAALTLALVTLAPATLNAAPARASGATAPSAKSVAPAVHISNFTFGPQMLTVRVGQTVTWTNDDDIPHTVVATDKSFRSKVLDTGQSFSFTFARPGLVPYFCSLHPHMTGKIMVVR